MRLFRQKNRDRNADTRRTYAYFELARTCVAFCAALAFLVGSVLFYHQDLKDLGTTLFVVGSVLFVLNPTLRLVREIRLVRMGELKRLAEISGP